MESKKRKIYTYSALPDIVEKFKKQSERKRKSVSSRIENYMVKELEKEKK